jgi:diguanylate cyclase (GGDEF)-like protein
MFHTIRTKIILLYTILTISFTSVLLFTLYVNEKERVLNLALESSAEISRLHAALLSQEFTQYVALLKLLSEEPHVKMGNVDHIRADIKRLMLTGNGDFINVVYVDKDLNLIDSKGLSAKVTHSEFIKGAQWGDKEYNVTSPLKSLFEDALVSMVAVPVRDSQDQWQGTLAVAVSIDALTKRLASIKLVKGSYAWISDKNGDVISHPNPDAIMNFNTIKAADFGFQGFDSILKKIESQNNGYGRYRDLNINEDKILTFSKIESVPGWVLHVTTIESDIFSDIYAILWNVFTVSNVLMIIFMFMLSKFAKRITAPIVRLTKEVRASAVNQDQKITVIESNDEIGVLSRAFSLSLDKMHTNTSQLEALVTLRTKEIAAQNIALADQNERLEELASKDPLTQLYNRRAFNIFLEKEMARANRHGGNACLAMIDLDHFKQINDTHGHDIGDAVLRSFAACILENTRQENVVCRWGGEEFVVLLPEANVDAGMVYLDILRNKLKKLKIYDLYKITFSAGVSEYQLEEEAIEWIQRADNALYNAKESGRNRVVSA